jgi:integrase
MKHIRSGRATVLLTERAKKLVEVETRIQEKAAGATKDPATVKGKLVEFSFWLSKQGYDEEVVKWRAGVMKRLVNLGANLWDPETVKEVLAKQKWNDGYKMLIVYSYENFLKMEGLSWKRPKYKQPEALPFIPAEAELDQLIAACGKKLGTFLQGLKDTGADPGELGALQWIDINTESRTIQIRPVKGHNPRISTVSQQFMDRLQRFKTSERIFNMKSLARCLQTQRKRTSDKFINPRFLKISFRTFRHWKGTMEYHRTKDILYVKKILGHKQIRNTLKYIDLEATQFKTVDDQFIAKVTTNAEEACSLIEVGFEYVTGEYNDGGKIFRKRK